MGSSGWNLVQENKSKGRSTKGRARHIQEYELSHRGAGKSSNFGIMSTEIRK
jgi:hypothetical protein